MTSILITGNTTILTHELLDILTEDNRLVVTAADGMEEYTGRDGNLTVYKTAPGEEKFEHLFAAYSFDLVLYVSGYADRGEGLSEEHKWLESTFACCMVHKVSKFILLSTTESRNYTANMGRSGELLEKHYESQRAFSSRQLEEWCAYLASLSDTRLITIWCPYMAGAGSLDCMLNTLFSEAERSDGKNPLELPYADNSRCDFVSMHDIARLLSQIFQETEDGSGEYCLVSGYKHTWSDVASALSKIRPDLHFRYSTTFSKIELPDYPYDLRKIYGFIPMDDPLDDLTQYYRDYLGLLEEQKRSRIRNFREALKKRLKGALKYIELILVFLLTEFAARYTSASVYFKIIDVRLLFIVMMAMFYGLKLGVAASVLECAVLVVKYYRMGIDPVVLFYNMENWIPFVFYIMAGSIVGYLVDKKSNEMSFTQKEMDLLRDKYGFLNRIYHGVLDNRSEYRRQILGFQDSFGKIFDAVQKLDESEVPGSVLMEGLEVLEDILKNHTVAIYTLDDWQRFGRLAVCSNSMLSQLTKSLRVSDYQELYDTVLTGEVYRNIEFRYGYPAYGCGVKREGKPAFLVLIWEAGADQYGIYYANLFRILCGLMQTSFIRALEYEELTHDRTYYAGTQITRPAYFRRLLQVQDDMREAGISDYVLVRFTTRDKEKLTEKLAGVIRATDILGSDEKGNIYMLLTQMKEQQFHFVGERLDEKNIGYTLEGRVL